MQNGEPLTEETGLTVCLDPEECGFAPEVRLLRGDCNEDGAVNVSDAPCTLNWLFGGAAAPTCVAALDTNGDAVVNIADAVALLNFLFAGGSAPVAPYPECGAMVAGIGLGCETPDGCLR